MGRRQGRQPTKRARPERSASSEEEQSPKRKKVLQELNDILESDNEEASPAIEEVSSHEEEVPDSGLLEGDASSADENPEEAESDHDETVEEDLFLNILEKEGSSHDLKTLKQRIATTVHLLSGGLAKLKAKAEQDGEDEKEGLKSWSKAKLLGQLTQDVSLCYGYAPPLAQYILKLFNPTEAIAFFEANEAPRALTLRTNTLKTRRRELAKVLIARGANVDPLGDWSNVGLKVLSSTVPVGATPEYCAGHYMIQSASSLIPVMALDPQPGELILDMAAAPGGKSTYIGQLMKNKGVLFCNELRKDRCSSLVGNLHRMDIRNSVVINMDGKQLKGKLPLLSRILLDAPCSGIGVISKDPSIKAKRGPEDFKQLCVTQKELLKTAIDMVAPESPEDTTPPRKGIVVYSTCSLSVEENEEVIDYIVNNRHVKIIPLGLPDPNLGEPGLVNYQGKRFDKNMKEARRLYPHLTNMDGFFVCKLQKISDTLPARVKKNRQRATEFVQWGPEKWKSPMATTIQEFDEQDEAEEDEADETDQQPKTPTKPQRRKRK